MMLKSRVERMRAIAIMVGSAITVWTLIVLRVLAFVVVVVLFFAEACLPRLGKWAHPAREALRKRVRHAWRRAKKRPVYSLITLCLTALVTVNGTIRATGGSPELLSTSRLGEKSIAVFRLALHMPFHALGACDDVDDGMIREAAREHDIPAALVRAVAFTESSFRPHVISHAGAMGVMQLMPGTAHEMGVRDPFDPKQSLHGGAKYLARLHRRYRGNIQRTAAAYHAGPGAVPVRGRLRVGPITRRYMKRISQRVTHGI